MSLTISSRDRARLLRLAASSPEEVCGLLLGSAGRIEEVRVCGNVAADPATAFEIDPAELLAAWRAVRVGGPAVIGHFHSHPNGSTRPSERDAAAASPDGQVWLIVAGGAIGAWRAVADGAVHGKFSPIQLVSPPDGCTTQPASSEEPDTLAPESP